MTAVPAHTLVLGGVRSGKSAFAEGLALGTGLRPVYVATAVPAVDPAMAERVGAHRARRGPEWAVVEEPVELAAALAREAGAGRVVLVDCLTLWMTNLMVAGLPVRPAADGLAADAARGWAGAVVLVSNEVGLGGIAADAMTRAFADEAGRLHQALAASAAAVALVAAGLPLWLKRPIGGG